MITQIQAVIFIGSRCILHVLVLMQANNSCGANQNLTTGQQPDQKHLNIYTHLAVKFVVFTFFHSEGYNSLFFRLVTVVMSLSHLQEEKKCKAFILRDGQRFLFLSVCNFFQRYFWIKVRDNTGILQTRPNFPVKLNHENVLVLKRYFDQNPMSLPCFSKLDLYRHENSLHPK